MSSLSDDQLRELFGSFFDLHPLAHTMALFAPLAHAVDFIGMYQETDDQDETEYRAAFQQKNRHDFVEACLLTWKYRVNVDPKHEGHFKGQAFEAWRNMPMAYQDTIFPPGHDVGEVPVPRTTNQTQYLVKSLFWLSDK